ncbi:hypothetical protein DOTSEDRAFT_73949 [Dothistroma septosporum NZE10]|uniref:Methyltransferase domain-containing protein n=1 Tax=Dothistroma septosporum (strain NZE10 / CBS 128990) TaxID=675120 RepID=N1PGL2_DOTSN|nr:hypothetical protein DOTSEDRAFT_73949 [Dothistroma septosporum NZE10]
MSSEHELKAPDHWTDFNKLIVDDPSFKLTPEVKELFHKYTGIPEDQIVQHVVDVRDRAFKIFPYPCIGQFNFLDFGVSKAPKYKDVLEGVKAGKTLLDVGCCFGQDLRKLTHDGADSKNLMGFEMKKEFTDLGYDLFRDRDSLKSNFVFGDFFAPIPDLEGKQFDYIHASSFFHLFSWDDQVTILEKFLGLLKQRHGTMVFGRQACVPKAGVLRHEKARGGEMFRHDKASFKRMVEEATKGAWAEGRFEVEVGTFKRVIEGKEWDMMNFSMEVQ